MTTDNYGIEGAGKRGYNPFSYSGQTFYYPAKQRFWKFFGGTSAAAPHVAGLSALLLSINPDLTVDEIYNTIRNTAKRIDTCSYSAYPNCKSKACGFGRINPMAAIISVAEDAIFWNPEVLEYERYNNNATQACIYGNQLNSLHFVWESYYDIFYSHSTDKGLTWECTSKIDRDTLHENYGDVFNYKDAYAPALAVDKNRVPHVVYIKDQHGIFPENCGIYYTKKELNTDWLVADELIHSDDELLSLDFALDTLGYGHICYEKNSASQNIRYMKINVETTPPTIVSQSTIYTSSNHDYARPSIAISPDGIKIGITFTANVNNQKDIYFKYSNNGGQQWSGVSNLTNSVSESSQPYLVRRIGTQYFGLVWTEKSSENCYDIKFRACNYATWSWMNLQSVASSSYPIIGPQLFNYAKAITWVETEGIKKTCYYTYWDFGINNFKSPIQYSHPDDTLAFFTRVAHMSKDAPVIIKNGLISYPGAGSYEDMLFPGKYFKFQTYEKEIIPDPYKKEHQILPEDYSLHLQIYPNPFNASVTFDFGCKIKHKAKILIYNILGQQVEGINCPKETEIYIWDVGNSGKRFSSGIYFTVVKIGNQEFMKKLTIIK